MKLVSFDKSREDGKALGIDLLSVGCHNVKGRLKAQQEGTGHQESSGRKLPKGG